MSDIRFGFVTTSGMGWQQSFDIAEEAGFDFVELWQDGPNAPWEMAEATDALLDRCDASGVDLLCHLPFSFDLGSPYDPVREASIEVLEESLRTAGAAGAEKGVLHPVSGAYPGAWSAERIRENVAEAVESLHRYGLDHGVEVCPENIFETRFTVHDMELLLDETDADMTLDTGHARVSGMEGAELLSFVDEHADRISHVHLNESRRAEDEHLPIGMGDLPVDGLLDRLEAADWSGTVSLEVVTADPEYIEMSKRKVDRLR